MPSFGVHFKQYLYHNHLPLCIDHKPFEWLAIVLDAYGKSGTWINMLQDFSFKILHCAKSKHGNVDALSRNSIGSVDEDKEFQKEIQDCNWMQ
jgi:hypothetical protein